VFPSPLTESRCPVDRKSMDEAVEVLQTGIKSSKVKREEQVRALKRLRKCVPPSDPVGLRTIYTNE